ncbi:MAG TPA: elongation factor G [Euzebya sp.]|nr:elongation factor G [Euzebya sp.]
MTLKADSVRNVVLVGHAGTGKTTLAEAMLYRAGVITRLGRVEDGTTVLDTEPEEQRRTESLRLSMAPIRYGDHLVNVLDTPGYADFLGDALTGLWAADMAVFVIDGVNGVQTSDVLLWRTAARWRVPRLVFINKLDRGRASYDRVLAEVRDQFGSGIEPVELPLGAESSFHGVADLLTEHAFLYDSGQAEETAELPPEIADREHEAHEALVEDVVEFDDALLETYLEGHEPTVEELEHALHEGVDAATVFPVLCGSATGPIAVDRLLEFICHVGPAPADLPPAQVEIAGGDDLIEVPCDPGGPTAITVFATRADDYVGQITLFKVISGTLRADDILINVRTGAKERLHSLVRVRGDVLDPVEQLQAGDIAGVTKLSDLEVGDTLSADGLPWRLPMPALPQPVHGLGITTASTGEEDKFVIALAKLLREDPSLQIQRNDETHQTVLWGAGDVHVQVALERLERRYGVAVTTEPVRIAYRETITQPVQVEARHKKQSGGRGQFAVAHVRFEPLPQGEGFTFDSAVVGGAIPRSLIPAVGAGIQEAMARGGVYGFPVVDLAATVTDGKYHSVDSDEMSFKMAGALALKEGLPQAGVVVLEPISHVEVTVPSTMQGEVMGDLQQRRGHVEGTEQGQPGEVLVIASVPTSELLRYAIDLRSFTHGQARFTAEHDRYEPLPTHLIETVRG